MAKAFLEVTTEFTYDEESAVCDKVNIHEFGKAFLPVFYVLVSALGLLGNLLVVFAITKGGRQKSITDIFLLNLAISDLLFVISLPFWASYVIRGWTLGNIACKIISSLYYVGFFGGMFFITVISIDRYLAIVQAVFSFKARTVSHGCVTSLGVWSVALLVSVPHFVFNQKTEEQCTSVYPDHLKKIWPIFCMAEMNVLGFLIPAFVISYCYFGIIRTLLACKNHKKTKAIKLILVVVIVFFVFWTPYNVLIFLDTLKNYELVDKCNTSMDHAMHATEALAFSHCCLNPFIYAFAGEKFRKYLHRLFLKYCSCLCFCGPCSQYQASSLTTTPESMLSSNPTQNTSDQEASAIL
uniref:C-X3-C motif chemokine receptor 1 n=2 Tax=Pelodiscus sinensis TaxID=13735 RepID=K7EZT7_PELSI|nr:CX3C chemokine receptor 1 isoform X2 [Pelodiscus sinensis]XP_014428372.1 CX3C chemokine receptor 1 isoform X2 [Pelodiscus sinensis]|eukprot:XP_014428371.1 CX3C chemokine receptor 1 isoform X2 [Pelodiscus sinensis]